MTADGRKKELSLLKRWSIGIGVSDLQPTTRLVAFALATWMDEDGVNCFPSVESIAGRAGFHVRAARRKPPEPGVRAARRKPPEPGVRAARRKPPEPGVRIVQRALRELEAAGGLDIARGPGRSVRTYYAARIPASWVPKIARASAKKGVVHDTLFDAKGCRPVQQRVSSGAKKGVVDDTRGIPGVVPRGIGEPSEEKAWEAIVERLRSAHGEDAPRIVKSMAAAGYQPHLSLDWADHAKSFTRRTPSKEAQR